MQLDIFLHTKENNKASEAILKANKDHLNGQCKRILEILRSGIRLTVRDAMVKYGIGDLRRRVCDLREKGIEVKSELKDGRFKEYFLD